MTERNIPEWMGKNRGLTPEELAAFLASPVVARIATVDEHGFPYITPIWQEWLDGAMYIIPREKTAFVKHLKNNPKVAISCALDSGTYTRMLLRGEAEILFGPARMEGLCLEIGERMSLRYLGEHGPEYLAASLDRPRYLIRISPSPTHKLITWDGVEWAEKYLNKPE
ncbi:MAG: pyridoxamine 5'-phosphate oxidase family protein [Chloroflexota bacterium]|nr:pyridoxamine 5'-phosphate oxidase family protein [Chloroflexota bacterium]